MLGSRQQADFIESTQGLLPTTGRTAVAARADRRLYLAEGVLQEVGRKVDVAERVNS